GLLQSIFGTSLPDVPVAFGLLLLSMVILAAGRYALLEDVTRVLVIVFTIATVIAAIVAFVTLDVSSQVRPVFKPFEEFSALDQTVMILFLVSVAGWMPTGAAGSVGLSLWVKA